MYEQLKLDNQLCFRLYATSRLVTQAYHPYLSELGLTYPQYLVLLVLWEQDRQPVNDLAKRLHLETNTVTPLLQRMEKLGLVSRKKGELDKRQQIVSLTKKGKLLEEKAFATIPSGMEQQLLSCPLKQEDYPRLAQELDAIIDSLKK